MGSVKTACLVSSSASSSRTPVAIFFLSAFLPAFFASHTLLAGDLEDITHPLPGDVVINELMIDPAIVGDIDGEYIELYNRTSSAIDLNGWMIRDLGIDEHVIDNGGPLMIGAGEFLILARNGVFEENGGVEVDYEYAGFVLSNAMDEVILVDGEGTTIDSLIYHNELGFPLEVGRAMELRNYYWDNTMGITWSSANEPFGAGDLGSPGSMNSVYEEFKWVAIDAATGTPAVSPGDSLIVGVDLFNPAWRDWSCDAASFLVLPGGSPFQNNPVDGPLSLELWEGRTLHARRAYAIPESAHPGTYELYYGVREHGGQVFDYERIEFTVSTLMTR